MKSLVHELGAIKKLLHLCILIKIVFPNFCQLQHPAFKNLYWWVQNFPGGCQSKGGGTYYLANFFLKSSWKWKKLDRGRHASMAPPWISQWKWQSSFIFYKAFFFKMIQLAQFDKSQKSIVVHLIKHQNVNCEMVGSIHSKVLVSINIFD